MTRTSSLSEKPISQHPRRLADWLNPTGAKKVHSLVDKVYKMKNLELAWEKVRQNKGAGGVDGQSIEEFEREAARKTRTGFTRNSRAIPTSRNLFGRKLIPKPGQPGKYRDVGHTDDL